MSHENVDLVKRYLGLMVAYEAHQETPGDYGPVLELLDDHIVVRVPVVLPFGGEWVGHEGFVQMANAAVGARRVTGVPQFTYLDAGDEYVVLLVSYTFEAVPGGKERQVRMVQVYTVHDSKITSHESYYEDARVLLVTE
jgi:hypothetical protein